jgi:signal peptide peptidase SppA
MTTRTYDRIIGAFLREPWAIQESKFRQIEALLRLRAEGGRVEDDTIHALVSAAERAKPAPRQGMVAVIPVFGVIAHRMDLFTEISGGTSTMSVLKAFRAALADPEVSGIVLEVDSPGGGVSGVPELADEIFQARGQKPVIAVANTLMASAAYWIGSQADELIVTPSGEVGSIGVFAVLENWAKFYENEGLKMEILRYGDNKAEINDFEEVSDEARAHLKAMIDDVGRTFDKAVARGRGVTPAHVRAEFGQGRTFLAPQAVKLGLADRVGTIDDAIVTAGKRRKKMSAEQPGDFITATADPEVDLPPSAPVLIDPNDLTDERLAAATVTPLPSFEADRDWAEAVMARHGVTHAADR